MPTKVLYSRDDAESSYYCPIHPEILRDQPGACSRCGMPMAKETSNEDWDAGELL
ncbi:MAG TPA: heavy metal-binding domain-containing protein [bacterium]|nr:heavy metal-binding domain-containing protein [bacterium]